MNAKMSGNSAKLTDPLRGTSSLVRPHYSAGLLLQDDDLTQAVNYTRELSRLLFRSLFGCGVVCGLEVNATDDCGKVRITIDKGVALDCHGDPVEVPSKQVIVLDPSCGAPIPPTLCIVLRRHEWCCMPRTTVCADDDEDDPQPAYTREKEGFEIRVHKHCPDCACGCDPEDRPSHADATGAGATAAAAAAASPAPARGAGGGNRAGASSPPPAQVTAATHDCQCADPKDPCYEDHYQGKCHCDCCSNDWVVLGRLEYKDGSTPSWTTHYDVRRFVRPVLMADPQQLKPSST